MSNMFEELRRGMNASGPQDPDKVVANLDKLRAQTEQMLERYAEIMGADEQTYEGSSPDGRVTATLDSTGKLINIDVTEGALHNVRSTGGLIMAAINAAKLAHSAAMIDLVGKIDNGAFGLMDKLNEALPQETREALKTQRREY